jgi:hypothetical protein
LTGVASGIWNATGGGICCAVLGYDADATS